MLKFSAIFDDDKEGSGGGGGGGGANGAGGGGEGNHFNPNPIQILEGVPLHIPDPPTIPKCDEKQAITLYSWLRSVFESANYQVLHGSFKSLQRKKAKYSGTGYIVLPNNKLFWNALNRKFKETTPEKKNLSFYYMIQNIQNDGTGYPNMSKTAPPAVHLSQPDGSFLSPWLGAVYRWLDHSYKWKPGRVDMGDVSNRVRSTSVEFWDFLRAELKACNTEIVPDW